MYYNTLSRTEKHQLTIIALYQQVKVATGGAKCLVQTTRLLTGKETYSVIALQGIKNTMLFLTAEVRAHLAKLNPRSQY